MKQQAANIKEEALKFRTEMLKRTVIKNGYASFIKNQVQRVSFKVNSFIEKVND